MLWVLLGISNPGAGVMQTASRKLMQELSFCRALTLSVSTSVLMLHPNTRHQSPVTGCWFRADMTDTWLLWCSKHWSVGEAVWYLLKVLIGFLKTHTNMLLSADTNASLTFQSSLTPSLKCLTCFIQRLKMYLVSVTSFISFSWRVLKSEFRAGQIENASSIDPEAELRWATTVCSRLSSCYILLFYFSTPPHPNLLGKSTHNFYIQYLKNK